jgi:hypothetical protein
MVNAQIILNDPRVKYSSILWSIHFTEKKDFGIVVIRVVVEVYSEKSEVKLKTFIISRAISTTFVLKSEDSSFPGPILPIVSFISTVRKCGVSYAAKNKYT